MLAQNDEPTLASLYIALTLFWNDSSGMFYGVSFHSYFTAVDFYNVKPISRASIQTIEKWQYIIPFKADGSSRDVWPPQKDKDILDEKNKAYV